MEKIINGFNGFTYTGLLLDSRKGNALQITNYLVLPLLFHQVIEGFQYDFGIRKKILALPNDTRFTVVPFGCNTA